MKESQIRNNHDVKSSTYFSWVYGSYSIGTKLDFFFFHRYSYWLSYQRKTEQKNSFLEELAAVALALILNWTDFFLLICFLAFSLIKDFLL